MLSPHVPCMACLHVRTTGKRELPVYKVKSQHDLSVVVLPYDVLNPPEIKRSLSSPTSRRLAFGAGPPPPPRESRPPSEMVHALPVY